MIRGSCFLNTLSETGKSTLRSVILVTNRLSCWKSKMWVRPVREENCNSLSTAFIKASQSRSSPTVVSGGYFIRLERGATPTGSFARWILLTDPLPRLRMASYSAIDSGDAQRRVREDCKAMQLQRQAAAIFPSVWDKLILGPDPLLVELFEEEVEAESGVRPRKQHVVAFIKEKGTSRITPSPVTRPLSRSLISAPPDPSTARYNSEHTLAAFLDNLLAEAQGTGTTWAEASKVACAEATRRGHKTRQTPATLKAHARYRGFVVLEGEKVDLLSPSVSNQAAVEVTPPADKWEPLTNLNPPSSQRPSCPAAIRFWDGSERPLKAWREILRSVVEKLNGDEKLTVNDLPIRSGSKRYCVHTKPFHPTGVGFTSPRSVGDGSLFVEAHVSSKAAREYAKLVLEHCGQNPEEVYLQVK